MKVEKIEAISLDRHTAQKYAEYVIKEQIGQVAVEICYLGGGSFGRVFAAEFDGGAQIVVKFLRAHNMLQKEVNDLKLLLENCSVKIPTVLFIRKADGIIPVDCYAMERIEGKNVLGTPSMFFKSKRKRLEFADKVADALHTIHQCTNDKFGDTLSADCSTWIEYYKPFAGSVLDCAEKLYDNREISKRLILTMREAWTKFDEIFAEPIETACLIHGDLNIANIMVDAKGNITGFIDPLNSMYADREYDLFQLDNMSGKRFYLRDTYIRKFGASRLCDVKCAFYGLWNEVYCYITSGVLIGAIMNPLIKNMRKKLDAIK